MKKVLLILCIFMFIPTCYAAPIGVWTDEVLNDSTIKVVNQEKRYQWYRDNIILSDNYYLRGENDLSYPLIKDDDFIETDWSNWDDTEPQFIVDRLVESENSSLYRTIRPIRYLFLNNFYNRSGEFRISKINILIDNNPIATDMICTNCSAGFTEKLYNGASSDSAYIMNAGGLRVDLGNYYSIERITVEVYLYSYVFGNESFDIYYNEDGRIDYRNYAYRKLEYNVISSDSSNPNKLIIIPDKSFIVHPSYSDWGYIEGTIEPTFFREVKSVIRYRYKDRLFRYYRVEREYYSSYVSMLDDPSYIKDESSMKNFYIYSQAGSGVSDQYDSTKAVSDQSSSVASNVDKSVTHINSGAIPQSNISKKVFQADKTIEELSLDSVALINDSSDVSIHKDTVKTSAKRKLINMVSNNLLILLFILLIISFVVFIKNRRHILSHQK